LSPCGHEVDFGRDYQFVGQLFPFRDRPDIGIEVLFFPVPLSTPPVPFPNPFVLRNYDVRERLDQTPLGTDQSLKTVYTGPTPVIPVTPGKFCGTADMWENGLVYEDWLAGRYPACNCTECPLTLVNSVRNDDGTLIVNPHVGNVEVHVNQGATFDWTAAHTWTVGPLQVWIGQTEALRTFNSENYVRLSGPGVAFAISDAFDNPEFSIGTDGEICTNQTGPPPALGPDPVTYLAIFDETQTLLGYIPVYNTPPPPLHYLLDNFVDTDGTALTAHTMDVGPGWTTFRSLTDFVIETDTATALTADQFAVTSDATHADAVGSVQMTFGSLTDTVYQAIYFRASDDTNWWIVQLLTSGNWSISKMVAGAFSTVGGGAITVTTATAYTVTVTCAGDSITVNIDGVDLTTVTDAFNDTATLWGLGRQSIATDSGSYFTAFSVDP
jgi:hypothetical protein